MNQVIVIAIIKQFIAVFGDIKINRIKPSYEDGILTIIINDELWRVEIDEEQLNNAHKRWRVIRKHFQTVASHYDSDLQERVENETKLPLWMFEPNLQYLCRGIREGMTQKAMVITFQSWEEQYFKALRDETTDAEHYAPILLADKELCEECNNEMRYCQCERIAQQAKEDAEFDALYCDTCYELKEDCVCGKDEDPSKEEEGETPTSEPEDNTDALDQLKADAQAIADHNPDYFQSQVVPALHRISRMNKDGEDLEEELRLFNIRHQDKIKEAYESKLKPTPEIDFS